MNAGVCGNAILASAKRDRGESHCFWNRHATTALLVAGTVLLLNTFIRRHFGNKALPADGRVA